MYFWAPHCFTTLLNTKQRIMGMVVSLVTGKGLAPNQMLNSVIGKLYDDFIDQEPVKDFEAFHLAILKIYNILNVIVPGKHYEVPPFDKVEELFEKWKNAGEDTTKKETIEDERKKIVKDFMIENVNLRKIDSSMVLAGMAAPPAAMIAKRAGEGIPQLKLIKVIPDVIFVPSATLLALSGFKLTRSSFWKKTTHV